MSSRSANDGGEKKKKNAPVRPQNSMMFKSDAHQLEPSEEALLSSLDQKRAQSKPRLDGFRAAVEGERPPLGNASLGTAFETEAATAGSGKKPPALLKFKNIARKVHQMNVATNLAKQMKENRPKQHAKHHRVTSLLASIDDEDIAGFGAPSPPSHQRTPSHGSMAGSVGDHSSPAGMRSRLQQRSSTVLNETLHAGTLGQLLMDVNVEDFGEPVNNADTNSQSGADVELRTQTSWNSQSRRRINSALLTPDESLPLLQTDVPNGGTDFAGLYTVGGTGFVEETGLENSLRPDESIRPASIFQKLCSSMRCVVDYLTFTFQWISYHFFHSTLFIAFLCSIAALILFYHLSNPEFDFLPGRAKLSWWCNFVSRQCVIFELARLSQWIVVDWFALATPWGPKVLGPLSIIALVQSKDGPFVLTMWGLLNSMVLHGDHPLQRHWLNWTGFKIYSEAADSGNYILISDEYTRFLFVLLILGMATTTKNTITTLYFGRRNFDLYKEKLEKILMEIIVISEIADLAEEAGKLPDRPKTPETNSDNNPKQGSLTRSENSSSSSFEGYGASETVSDQADAKDLAENMKSKDRRGKFTTVRWQSLKFNNSGDAIHGSKDDDTSAGNSTSDEEDNTEEMNRRNFMSKDKRFLSRDSSINIPIKKMLDRWKEPLNKADRSISASIHDIYKFRKALAYMDMVHPFAESFGPASTRDECITSAQIVYEKLLKISPIEHALSFEVLEALCFEDGGDRDTEKFRIMKRLFRPGKGNKLGTIAFVQSCDNVYKKLRYFRASVGNSSVIDSVLESVINTAFHIGISLVLLSIMKFNPWPLLVSMSTLMVTFAFAVGPSIAKMIEGILLIVLRRPYDIGDRIVIAENPGAIVIENETAGGWFVEDITLFTTTLRFAPSNAVASISNGSIASSRITNCARSLNAIVFIVLKVHIKIHQKEYARDFVKGMELYVADNPRSWDMLLFFRCEEIDADNEATTYRLCCRSRHNWQVAARVLDDRAKLRKHCEFVAGKLGVAYDSPRARRILYYGGALENGAIQDYKSNLLSQQNISRKEAGHERSASAPDITFGKPEEEPHPYLQDDSNFMNAAKKENSNFLKMVKEAIE